MSKTLFIGNMESPLIKEVLETLVLSGKELIMSVDSYQVLGECTFDNEMIRNRVQTWSWNDSAADFHIQDAIMDLFPYLYPDTFNPIKLEKLLNVSQQYKRSYSSFRLGFGVQEELFDLFLAQFFEVTELAYFDVLSSLQLLNPASQLEYRKRAYGFLRFKDKEQFILSEQSPLLSKRYEITRSIPFYESFSEKFGHPAFISHYVIEK
ncbi:hypothetical protein A8L34_09600 [Bacillus sp. FJAT-27264]|uniref:hypothetical protein n=1 Tax=Paenibacillus sp. (strain DSM 101736 / FJAT-27264) TaxID=1850362 RepID=UPI000807FE9B|nr:hypothetical protein [Bacillus sp. FJAT-27264]OBZ14205.1 hypothetical protein A8L34_09600 [Bacillus sp. FJAT-27264]